MDFLGSEDPQLIIGLFTQPLWPIITFWQLNHYFRFVDDSLEEGEGLTQEYANILTTQTIFQVIQLICFFYVIYIVPVRPDSDYGFECLECLTTFLRKKNRYIALGMTYTYCIVVPAVSIVHWLIFVRYNTNEKNMIRPWTAVYPLVGVFTIIYYYFIIKQVIDMLYEGYNLSSKNLNSKW